MVQKLDELQWCRGLAILAVLCYHLWPSFFPNGFLGVDVFFVISGFIICANFEHLLQQNSFFPSLQTFYARRIKRIFPNYFLVLFLVVVAGPLIFLEADQQVLQKDAKWAAAFATNIQIIDEDGSYYRLTSAFKPLLH
uniref:Acyltransferase 3 domain-containing protein n=1 Tax=Panagrolaimus sp. JU765 TaxID=591449 RepID=A0AC34R5K5_9BILA